MNKTWVVLKNEFINTVSRRSFLLTLILVPLVPAIILGVIGLINRNSAVEAPGLDGIFQPDSEAPLPEGYVDRAGLITQLPDWLETDQLLAYTKESQAKDAVLAGEIGGYYVIEPDYLETGAIRYIREEFNPWDAMEPSGLITAVIQFNLLGANQEQFQIYKNPVQVQMRNLAPEEEERDTSSPLAFYVPYAVTMLFYILILTSSSMLLNSIAKEKENRVMEILISSLKPNQLLTGKILGLGLVGLLQMIVWMGAAIILLRVGGTTLNIPPSLQLSPEILFWGIIFFILGYLLYATIMAGIGALVPNLKEASQATFVVIIPILIPLMLVGVIIEQPHATLPVILSLIPFTAPNTIMTRMAVSPVPLWQLLTAIGLTSLTIFLLIRAVSGMFRAQLLLTGKKFTPASFLQALLGRDLEGEHNVSA